MGSKCSCFNSDDEKAKMETDIFQGKIGKNNKNIINNYILY